MQHNGRVVVTGAADGIGLASCRILQRDGFDPVMLDRNHARLASAAAALDAEFHVADVTREDELRAVHDQIEAAAAERGPVVGLVNSAGIVQRPLPPDLLPMEEYDRVLDIDHRGTYLACRVFGSTMARRGRGAIVNIASITGMRSVPLHAYAPAKAAVIAMGECLAGEWGPSGVRVNTVSPGYTLTERVRRQLEEGERDPEVIRRCSVMNRFVEPDEIAEAVAFLMSPRASAITGVNLPVDCGWLLAPSWTTYGGLRPKPDAL